MLHPRSAFISYVRRRGEPDGGGGLDSSLANTTDSEHSLSDGYATQAGSGQPAPRLGYASLRGPVRVSRPGGGGESDAAFTPSPPVTDPSLSLALAHQTRIRCLYAQPGTVSSSAAPSANTGRRPDSSSSASSTTTDWEGSGHATVLRRGAAAGAQQQQLQQTQQQQQPPLPPPRPPVYHNLGAGGRSKPKIKLGSAQSSLAARVNKEHALFMDRLSVRTELNAPASTNGAAAGAGPAAGMASGGQRKALTLTEEEAAASVAFNPASLYFSPADSELLGEPKQPLEETPVKPSAKCIQDSILRHMNRELTPSISELYHERSLGLGLAPPLSKLLLSPNYEEQEVTAMGEGSTSSGPGNAAAIKTLVDAVNELELSGSSSGATIPTVVGGEPETNHTVSNPVDSEPICSICGEHADVVCRCKAATIQKKATLKPWLSNVPASSLVQASELTTADILERRLETVVPSVPFAAELCRRDEGDGRSVADSQCSSNYKRVLATAGAVSLVVGIGAAESEAQNATSAATCSAARLV